MGARQESPPRWTERGHKGAELWRTNGSWPTQRRGQAGHGHPVLDLHWKELGAFFTRDWLWLLSVALRDMSWFTNTDWVPPRNNPKHWGCTGVLCVSKGSAKGLSSSPTSALEEAKFPPSSGFPLALLFVWLLSPFWSLVTCQLFVLKQPTSN